MNNIDSLSTGDIIDLYEAARFDRTNYRAALYHALAWRVFNEAPSRDMGIRRNGILYHLDCCDELVRTVTGRMIFTGHERELNATKKRRKAS